MQIQRIYMKFNCKIEGKQSALIYNSSINCIILSRQEPYSLL